MTDYPEGWVKPTKEELKTDVTPDDDLWKIKNILYSYHESVENLKTALNNEKINASEFNKKVVEYETLYAQAIKLLFTKEELSGADILLKNEFFLCAAYDGIIPSDGDGAYIDLYGNEVGDINWDNLNDYPQETAFVAWWNK